MRWLALAIAVGAAACVAPGDPIDDDSAELERPRGTFQVIDDRLFVQPPEGPEAQAAAHLLYMNRDGGAYTPGNNDSRTNRSSIIQQTRSIPSWQVSDTTWAAVMSCVRAQFDAYDIDVTDVDPGSVPHIESVVAGTPGDLGLPSGVGGVSPFTSTCGTIANSIVFSFAEALPQNPQIVCEVVAQEVSHSFGLDHEFLCEDPMTYLSGCGAKSFQNVFAPCGELEQRASCAIAGKFDCGRDTQNSVQLLSQRLGLKPGQPPSVTITAPADGAVVLPGFEVTADAVDDDAVTEVELLVDDASLGTLSAPPYSFTTPADLALGAHAIEVIARDGTGETSTSIEVEVATDPPPDDGGDGDGGGDTGDGGGGAGGDEDGDGVPDGSNPSLVGGCSAGGGGAGAAWLVLLVGLFLRRRRR